MAKKLDTSACTATVGFPPKQGTWDFLQQAHQEEAAAIVEGMIGSAYDPTKIYVIDGGVYSTSTSTVSGVTTTYANITAGALFFNGEIFPFNAPAPFPITSTQTVVADMVTESYVTNPITGGPANADPVQFAGTSALPIPVHDIRTVSFSAATSGSGMFTSQAGYPAGTTASTTNDIGNFVYLSNLVTTNINTLIENQTAGMAAAYGADNFNIAVVMSGMTSETIISGFGIPPESILTAGWFFYNNQYVYFAGGSWPPTYIGSPSQPIITISTLNGLPIAKAALGSGPASATQFSPNILKPWATAVGINVGGWQNIISFGTGWGVGPTTPRISTDGMGRSFLQGTVEVTTLTGLNADFAFLPGALGVNFPSQVLTFVCSLYTGSGSSFKTVNINVNTVGGLIIVDPSQMPTVVGAFIDLSSISYLSL